MFYIAGIGGSGRQSSAKLSTFMADYELFQIEITKNYTTTEWREDIKKVIAASIIQLLGFLFQSSCFVEVDLFNNNYT